MTKEKWLILKIAAFILDPLLEIKSGPELNAFKVAKEKLQSWFVVALLSPTVGDMKMILGFVCVGVLNWFV